ncbi:MAG: 3d domain [Verrucomicrobiaceae bacterium]|nr:3d domain [Verrucomicrobiaceae bacterium]
MMYLRIPLIIALAIGSTACQSATKESESSTTLARVLHNVKTTAYTHSEGDHLKHGASNAIGSTLKYGNVRSAAADWSVYPVGTKFKIQGESSVYVVDDYGSALVGTHTIDLYKPSKASMNSWGARKVNIDVIEWGSYTRSLAILKPRAKSGKGIIRRMVSSIQQSLGTKGALAESE